MECEICPSQGKQCVHKENHSSLSGCLRLGRVNYRLESCDDLFGLVRTEDSGTSYDHIAP